MFFHFESKQRLKITISTQQATRTSADPFVPDSEYFPHNECICCRHQTWKIRRFVIRIQRMYPGRRDTVGHEERIHHMYPINCPVVDNDKPPSYVSLRHELSGEPSNTGAVAELPAVSLPVELPIQQSEHSSMCTGQAGPEYPNHEYDSVGEHTMHQTLNDGNTFRTSRMPWNLSTQPYSVPASGMISCQQSHNSSPTSVDTTNTNANYCAQFEHDIEFRHSMEVPCETYSPSQDSQVTPTMSEPDFVWHNGYALSSDVSPVEQPPCLSQGSGSGCSMFHNGNHAVYTSSIYSSGSETCIASSDISLEMLNPTKHLVSQRHSGPNGSPDVYDNHEHCRWGHQSECGFKINNAKFVNHSTMRVSLPQPPLDSDQSKNQWQSLSTYAELEDHQYPEVVPDSEIREEVDAGTVSCGKCHTIFRGKYRKGNLKRHDLAFHSPLASAVGKACRVCKKAFKRADATKKHEWKKHRLLDAKPKKRNTSQDWTQFV